MVGKLVGELFPAQLIIGRQALVSPLVEIQYTTVGAEYGTGNRWVAQYPVVAEPVRCYGPQLCQHRDRFLSGYSSGHGLLCLYRCIVVLA